MVMPATTSLTCIKWLSNLHCKIFSIIIMPTHSLCLMLAKSPGVEFSSKYPSLKRQINALLYVHVVDKKQFQIVVVQYRKEM